MLKKLTSLLLSLGLAMSLLACSVSAKTLSAGSVRIAGLKGPTTMVLVQLLSMEKAGTAALDYDLQLYGAADEIVPKLIKGELDLAAIPANLAATLYQKTNGGIQVLAVNTLGVLYVVEKGNTVHSFADLKGRTILSTGKGTTPEYVLRYLLQKNGLDPDRDVKIEYYSEASEVTAQMAAAKKDAIAVLPQPYVTAAQMKDAALRVVLDLTKEWNKVCGTQLITGVTVVRTAYAEERRPLRGSRRGGQGGHRKKGPAPVQHRLPPRRGDEKGYLRLPAGAVRCVPRRRGRQAAGRQLLLDQAHCGPEGAEKGRQTLPVRLCKQKSCRQAAAFLYNSPMPKPASAGSTHPNPMLPSGRVLARRERAGTGSAAATLCTEARPMDQA